MVDIKVLCATAGSKRMSWYCTCPADVECHVIYSRFELSCAHQSDAIEHTLYGQRAPVWPMNVLVRHNMHQKKKESQSLQRSKYGSYLSFYNSLLAWAHCQIVHVVSPIIESTRRVYHSAIEKKF